MSPGATAPPLRWLTPSGATSMRIVGDHRAFGPPLPRAQSPGEEELPGAGSGLAWVPQLNANLVMRI